LIPLALTGEAQRRATAALLGVPVAQVSDAMIQNLFARVTTPLGALRPDAAARIERAGAAPIDRFESGPPRPTTVAPTAPATRPTPPPPGGDAPPPPPPATATAPTSSREDAEDAAEALNERAATAGREAEKPVGFWARIAAIFERVGVLLGPTGG